MIIVKLFDYSNTKYREMIRERSRAAERAKAKNKAKIEKLTDNNLHRLLYALFQKETAE